MVRRFLYLSLVAIVIFFATFNTLEAKSPYSKVKNKETFAYIKNAPSFKDSANALVYLLKEEEYILRQDGTMVMRLHIIAKILKDSAKGVGDVMLWYNSYFQTLAVPVARTIKEDGTVLDLSPEAIQEAKPFTEYPVYHDMVARQFSLPQVEVGSVIEYEAIWIQERHPELKIPFSVFFAFPPGFQTLNSKLEISLPSQLKPKYQVKNIISPELEPKIINKKRTTTYIWEIKNIFPKRAFESHQPPYVEVHPYISFTTGESWDEIADWYRNLIKGQTESSKGIKNKVTELITEKDLSKEEIIKRLYYYVIEHIRYVAIELGMSAYRPYPASEVLKNGYGDCKAKSSLLIAMLKEMQIPAYFALIKTNNLGLVNNELPKFDFNHCIVAIPDKENYIFLDPTFEVNKYKGLPSVVQGVEALIIKEEAFEFTKTPLSKPEDNLIDTYQEINIKPDLSAEIFKTGSFAGEEANIRMGFKYMHPEHTKLMIKELISIESASAVLEDYKINNLDNIEQPFIIEIKYKVKDFCREVGDMIMFNVPAEGFLEPSLVADNYRKYPFWFLYVGSKKTQALIELPSGYRIKYLPEDMSFDYPFAYYSRRFIKDNGKIIFEEMAILKQNYFSAGKYGQLKNMVTTISRENKKDIVLEKETKTVE